MPPYVANYSLHAVFFQQALIQVASLWAGPRGINTTALNLVYQRTSVHAGSTLPPVPPHVQDTCDPDYPSSLAASGVTLLYVTVHLPIICDPPKNPDLDPHPLSDPPLLNI